jgi:ABC-type antimicrobial peptide transport system permease subunit
LVLVGIGVFSVIAYTVSRRTHEIGIRMALGANRSDVVGMVLRTMMTVMGVGMVIGLAVSFGVTNVLANQLFGVAPHDRRSDDRVTARVAIAIASARAALAAVARP